MSHYIIVVLLLRALRLTTWYQDSGLTPGSGPLSKEELVIGRLLHKFRLMNDMNAHPVWGVELNPKDPTQVRTEKVGQGLYTAIASYFNSDCNPNTLRLNVGRTMFLVASKNIRKGEEITDNYCIHFSDMEGAERRDWIMVSSRSHCHHNMYTSIVFQENFKFYCKCEACEDDWPTYSRISSDRPSEKVIIYCTLKISISFYIRLLTSWWSWRWTT